MKSYAGLYLLPFYRATYAECGYEIVCRLSVCDVEVCFLTYVGILGK